MLIRCDYIRQSPSRLQKQPSQVLNCMGLVDYIPAFFQQFIGECDNERIIKIDQRFTSYCQTKKGAFLWLAV